MNLQQFLSNHKMAPDTTLVRRNRKHPLQVTDESQSTIEGIRRKVMIAVHAVERETNNFYARYLSSFPGSEVEQWITLINRILQVIDTTRMDDLDDYKDLESLLDQTRFQLDIATTDEYGELKQLCERARAFDMMNESHQFDVRSARDLLRKYCLSFSGEAHGLDIEVVREYENCCIDWEHEMRDRLQLLDHLLDEYDRYRRPVGKYLQEYDRVLKLMMEVCRLFHDLCSPIKKWVIADAFYAKRLQSQINAMTKRRMELADKIKQTLFDRDQINLTLKRRDFNIVKAQSNLAEVKEEWRKLRRREVKAREQMKKCETDFIRKQAELRHIREQTKNRKQDSTAVYNHMVNATETLREELKKQQNKLNHIDTQITSLRKEEMQLEKRAQEHTETLESRYRLRNDKVSKIVVVNGELDDLHTELASLEDKISALKRIRELKLHSATVRRIALNTHASSVSVNFKDIFTESIRVAAVELGKDWDALYRTLPFVPPRGFQQRNEDIEAIDLANRSVDGGFQVLALKSMEKWRRQSKTASILDLVTSLKRIKRKDIARKIERGLLETNRIYRH